MTRDSVDTDPKSDDELLADPIKVRWTGYARGRISEYNADYQEPDEDSMISPDRFLKVVNRQKTNVVIKTVEEANAFRYELTSYDSSQRVWMNSSMDRAIDRVSEELDDEMAARGFVDQWGDALYGVKSFEGYVRESEIEEDDSGIEPGDVYEVHGQEYTVESVEDGYVVAENGDALALDLLDE